MRQKGGGEKKMLSQVENWEKEKKKIIDCSTNYKWDNSVVFFLSSSYLSLPPLFSLLSNWNCHPAPPTPTIDQRSGFLPCAVPSRVLVEQHADDTPPVTMETSYNGGTGEFDVNMFDQYIYKVSVATTQVEGFLFYLFIVCCFRIFFNFFFMQFK